MVKRRNGRTETIQLTPMIDVMATLLAVFMVTAPMMTGGIDLDLPKAGHGVASSPDHAMTLSVDKNGNYYLAEDKMALDKIIRKLAAMRRENPKLSIVIAGDKLADYGAVIRAMGGLRDAGFDIVSLQTRTD
jgi:biopolymer transport protein TolR